MSLTVLKSQFPAAVIRARAGLTCACALVVISNVAVSIISIPLKMSVKGGNLRGILIYPPLFSTILTDR
ncbi:MAG: hypothetical protein WC418_03405 [Candidatus Omnitrophota bacterium]